MPRPAGFASSSAGAPAPSGKRIMISLSPAGILRRSKAGMSEGGFAMKIALFLIAAIASMALAGCLETAALTAAVIAADVTCDGKFDFNCEEDEKKIDFYNNYLFYSSFFLIYVI